MRAWLLVVPLMVAVPSVAKDARPMVSVDDLIASLKTCGDDVPVGATPALMPGFGGGGFPITTASAQAQAFFDNGMQLAHAFAHHAASAAFAEAARIDPNCAMCEWGAAWSDGPTINFTISPATQKAAAAKVAAAEKLLTPASPARERDLIAALKLRYVDGGGKGSGDQAFARAMDALAIKYPQDDEILTIAADAWLIPAALNNVRANLPRSVHLLETVLKRNPDYTPAIHFYIHATEMSGFPKRAEPYADRLPSLAPASSHLIHMPSHTFYWIGRYQDAADLNVRAVGLGAGDAKTDGLSKPGQEWMLPYHGHNVQFGVGGALMSGDAKNALALSAPLLQAAGYFPDQGNLYIQMAMGTAYFAEGRFGVPADVLKLAEPGEKQSYARLYWRYARGEAEARSGNAAGVRAELAKLVVPALGPKADSLTIQARQLGLIAQLVLEGRALMLEKQPAAAARAFRKAAKLDEATIMHELSDPPAWWYPARRSYAAALLAAGRPRAALKQTDLVLARRPNDPVTLSLRADAEAALGLKAEAMRDRALAERGWRGDKALLAPLLA